MKPALVLNPRSAGGRTGRTMDALLAPVRRALGDVALRTTERPGHAVDLAREAALAGHPVVVAVGGDGTIGEVATGLMQAKERGAEAALGVIGAGTGGDFRRTLGLPHRLDRYLAVIARGAARTIDLARATYRAHDGTTGERFVINVLSAGMGGLVDRYVASSGRALGGSAAYLLASLRALAVSEIGVLSCEVTRGGATERRTLRSRQIAVCNARTFGGGMEVAPMARLDDGVLEVVNLGAASRLRFLTLAGTIYRGKHLAQEGVEHFPCEAITLDLVNEEVRDRFLLDVDGEALGTLPVRVQIVPAALRVLA